ncbi:MAG: histidinol-phosphate transaminase [Clostridia bacterium]
MASPARRALERIQPYVPGTSAEDARRLFGVHDAIKLSSNENPYGAGRLAREAAARAAGEIHLYPDGASRALREALGRHLDVDPRQVAVGCGSDEIFRMLAEAYLEPGRSAVFAQTTFSQYAFVTRLMDAEEVSVPLKEGVHDLWEMAYRARKHRARLVFVCNPNNPTGTYVTRAEVLRFLDAIPGETLVVFDEAYVEYVEAPDFPDVLELIREGRRVVSTRTFSKIHGLAGLRVGYAVGPVDVIETLERVRPPFNVNRVAQAAAVAALQDTEHIEMSRRINRAERQRLAQELKALGLRPYPSQANFVWVDLGRPSDEVYRGLLERGVIVRAGSSFGCPTALRISIGTPEQNQRLIDALAAVLEAAATKGEVGA